MNSEKIKQKIKTSLELFDFAFAVKKHQLKQKYPGLSEIDLQKATIELVHKIKIP